MKNVIRTVALSAAAAGVFVVLPGCQNRGTARKTDTTMESRPMQASATFDRTYMATRDTEYVVDPNTPGATRGTIARGTQVRFNTQPGASDWQQARVEGRGIVYVRPTDFSAAANQ